jgi:CRP/FNR family transcriptional regulator
MSQICLPLGLEKGDIGSLERIVQASNTFQKSDYIFRQGDLFSKVYAVKAGTLKSVRLDDNGNEHVIGFHLQGELIGLDGIYLERYSSSTIALDSAVLCELNYEDLAELCTTIPALQRQLLRLLSRDIYESNVERAESADQTALQKLGGFLHNLSTRYEMRGYSSTAFSLAMSRQDIANHLGLTPETVSRLLKQFKEDGTLEITNRHLRISNPSSLRDVLACVNA